MSKQNPQPNHRLRRSTLRAKARAKLRSDNRRFKKIWDKFPGSAIVDEPSPEEALRVVRMLKPEAIVAPHWLIMGANAARLFSELNGFTPAYGGGNPSQDRASFYGTQGGSKLYLDPHMPGNDILVGYKGDSFLDKPSFGESVRQYEPADTQTY